MLDENFQFKHSETHQNEGFFEKEYPGTIDMLGQKHPEKVQPFTVNKADNKGRIDLLIYQNYS